MIKKILFLVGLLIGVGQLTAQLQYDYNWVFNFQTDTASILNFRNDTFVVDTMSQILKISFSNGSISNAEGNLLFYTNGCEIYDSTLLQMENGFGLNPGSIANDNCDFGYIGWTQGLLILPSEIDSNIYHIFHKRIIIDENYSPIVVADSLFHTIVDMSQNSGLGEVVQKNKPINSVNVVNGNLTAVKRMGGGWWVVTALRDTNIYEIYQLRNDDIVETKQQALFETILEGEVSYQSLFSPNGSKYVRAVGDRGAIIFDFDRSNGQLSNPIEINQIIESQIGGAAISSNERFLYLNSPSELWQFDLEASDIEESKILIAEYDGFQSPFPVNFFQAQLGPDCKIYYNSTNGVDVLHVMHNPNARGTACNFEQHGIQLHSAHGISMPYFPSYRLDSDFPVCDSTRLVATSIQIPRYSDINLWEVSPNPTLDQFTISTNTPIQKTTVVSMYNMSGQLVSKREFLKGEKSIKFDLSDQPSGVYFYHVFNEKGNFASGRVIKL